VSAVWRTNRVGARLTFRVVGTESIDIRFGSTFQSNLSANHTATVGTVAVRAFLARSELNPPAFRYVPATGTVKLLYVCDPAEEYRVEVIVARLGTVHEADRTPVRGVGRWFNPGGVSFPDDTKPPYGAFVDVTGIGITDGATVEQDTSPLAALDVLLIGDQTIETAHVDHGHDSLRKSAFSESGVIESYPRLLLRRTALAGISPSRTPRIVALTHDEATLRAPQFPAALADSSYFGSTALWEAGAGVNLATGVAATRDPYLEWPGWVVDWMAQLAAGYPYQGASPELCLIALGLADADWQDTADPNWSLSVRDGVLGIVQRLHLLYGATVPVVIFKPHLPGPTGFSPWTGLEVDLVDDAIEKAVTELAGAPYNMSSSLLQVFSLQDVVAAYPGSGPWSRILSAAQHRLIADNLYADFATFCDDALSTVVPLLDFSVPGSSMYLAAF